MLNGYFYICTTQEAERHNMKPVSRVMSLSCRGQSTSTAVEILVFEKSGVPRHVNLGHVLSGSNLIARRSVCCVRSLICSLSERTSLGFVIHQSTNQLTIPSGKNNIVIQKSNKPSDCACAFVLIHSIFVLLYEVIQ